ncbi:MAG: RIP homotypic interaction motif-containing protein [Sulfuriferula sp.]
MNPFASLQNDTVYIENNTGTRSAPYKTAIGSKNGLSATIFEATLDAEEGWKLIRPLPSGKEEIFTILEANYSPGLHSIPPHWKLKLRKDSSMLNSPKPPQATTINITNSQGIQIGDHNVQHIASSLIGLVEKIESTNMPAQEKAEAKGLLRDLMSNPVVASILGSATSGVLALLG